VYTDDEEFAVVFGVDDDALFPAVVGVDFDLHFGVGINADVEDFAVLGEPGIGPAAIVTDTDGGHAVDDAQWPFLPFFAHVA
jgi:hypothetical protein